MKKQIIAASIAAAVAAPAAMAGAPTVYGQINMSIDNVTIDPPVGSADGDGVQISSNGSRLGVKGTEDLGNGLKAVYKIEYGVPVDSTSKGQLSGRDAYVGLAGSFGTVLLGRHDTPTKISQPTDFFNDGPADLKNVSVSANSSLSGGEVRANNVLAYVSPSFNGLKFVGAVVPSEGTKIDNAGNAKDSGLFDTYSAALMYGSKEKGLYAAASYDSYAKAYYDLTNMFQAAGITDVDGNSILDKYVKAGIAGVTLTRFSIGYTIGALAVNGLYQVEDYGKLKAYIVKNVDGSESTAGNLNDDLKSTETWQIQAAYTVGAFTPKAKYGKSDWDIDGAKTQDLWAVGVDYSLGKKTSAYVEYANVSNVGGEKDMDMSTLSIGLLHKF